MEFSPTNYLLSMALVSAFVFLPFLVRLFLSVCQRPSESPQRPARRQSLLRTIRQERLNRASAYQRLSRFSVFGCLGFLLFSLLQCFDPSLSEGTLLASSLGVALRLGLVVVLGVVCGSVCLEVRDDLGTRVAMLFGEAHPAYRRAYYLFLLATVGS